MAPRVAQPAAQPVGHAVAAGHGHDVGGRALHHGDVGGPARQLRHEGHGGGARADHRDPLAGPVVVLGPVLRMDHPPREVVPAREAGRVTGLVVVVAGAQVEEPRVHAHGAARRLEVQAPERRRAVPVGRHEAVAEAGREALGLGGLADVGQDRGAVGQGLLAGPGAERVAQGGHVRVRAHAGIAEQVPGAADGVAGLEEGEGAPRPPQVGPGADAREARADDRDLQRGGAGHRKNGVGSIASSSRRSSKWRKSPSPTEATAWPARTRSPRSTPMLEMLA